MLGPKTILFPSSFRSGLLFLFTASLLWPPRHGVQGSICLISFLPGPWFLFGPQWLPLPWAQVSPWPSPPTSPASPVSWIWSRSHHHFQESHHYSFPNRIHSLSVVLKIVIQMLTTKGYISQKKKKGLYCLNHCLNPSWTFPTHRMALIWFCKQWTAANLQLDCAKRTTMHNKRKQSLCFPNVNVKSYEMANCFRNIWSIISIIQFKQFKSV